MKLPESAIEKMKTIIFTECINSPKVDDDDILDISKNSVRKIVELLKSVTITKDTNLESDRMVRAIIQYYFKKGKQYYTLTDVLKLIPEKLPPRLVLKHLNGMFGKSKSCYVDGKKGKYFQLQKI